MRGGDRQPKARDDAVMAARGGEASQAANQAAQTTRGAAGGGEAAAAAQRAAQAEQAQAGAAQAKAQQKKPG